MIVTYDIPVFYGDTKLHEYWKFFNLEKEV